MSAFPIYNQLDSMDCGPACLCMIAKHYDKEYSLETLSNNSFIIICNLLSNHIVISQAKKWKNRMELNSG